MCYIGGCAGEHRSLLVYRYKEKKNKNKKITEARNMKKVLAMILCVSMMATALVGCGGSEPAADAPATEGAAALQNLQQMTQQQ